MTGEFLGHNEVDVATAEAGDEKNPVGMEVEEAIAGCVF